MRVSPSSLLNSHHSFTFPPSSNSHFLHRPPLNNKPTSIIYKPLFLPQPTSTTYSCTCNQNTHSHSLSCSDLDVDGDHAVLGTVSDDGVLIKINKLGKSSRKIEASIVISGGLQIVWDILTDYERLADFIPGLAVSRLLHKQDNVARLFQIGQQNLALGFKFNAKAVLDCYEKDIEFLSSCQRRSIEFKMIEGDFETFEGKWSIEEYDGEKCEGQECGTTLSYVLEVKPKLWLPVRLIEDRLCREIKTNLCCIREEAHLRLASSCS